MSTGNEDHAVIVHAAVFLSYRVSDTPGIADRLAVELMRAFGPDEVFLDKRSTESGQKWPDHIQHAIESSKVVLVLIGPRWLKAHDEFGERRLNSPEDWVRREVETALAGHADRHPGASKRRGPPSQGSLRKRPFSPNPPGMPKHEASRSRVGCRR
jgi:hypothetical protein